MPADTRTAWIISYTEVAREPRVIRQAQALIEKGWRVVVFGLGGEDRIPSDWDFVNLNGSQNPDFIDHLRLNWLRLQRVIGALFVRFGVLDTVKQWGAKIHQRAVPSFSITREVVMKRLAFTLGHLPDLVLPHDYFIAEVALTVAKQTKAAVVVDCHEYAMGQFVQDRHWQAWHQPIVKILQDRLFTRVDGITTVCQPIADLIKIDHSTRCPIQVVRSVPFYEPQPFKPTGETIKILYHGEIFPTRALHIAVGSMRFWRPEFRLVLRGYGPSAYVSYLQELAEKVGVLGRLEIQAPVPFNQIVTAANDADVGYFVHSDNSPQRRYVLPNKFFEYTMAGLALVVSDLPEMSRIVNQYHHGKLVQNCEEESIACAINSLDRASIDIMKRRSLEAAKELNWDVEKGKMISIYHEIMK